MPRSNRQNDEEVAAASAMPAIDGQAAPYTPYQDAMYYNKEPSRNDEYKHSFDDYHDNNLQNGRRSRHGRGRVVEEHFRRRRRYHDDDADDPANGIQEDNRPSPRDFFDTDLTQFRRAGGRGNERNGGFEAYEDEADMDDFRKRSLRAAALQNARRGQPQDYYSDYPADYRSRRGGGDRDSYYDDYDRSRRGRYDDRYNRSDSPTNEEDSRRGRHRSSRRSRSQTRRGRGDDSPPRNDPDDVAQFRPPEGYTLLKAAKSALMAGSAEAVRCRREPGPWTGQKGRRIAIAATTGVIVGSLRNGRLQSNGKMPYADAAMTGFYAIDFLKRVIRHTENDKDAKKERRDWREEAEGRAPWQVDEQDEESKRALRAGEKGGVGAKLKEKVKEKFKMDDKKDDENEEDKGRNGEENNDNRARGRDRDRANGEGRGRARDGDGDGEWVGGDEVRDEEETRGRRGRRDRDERDDEDDRGRRGRRDRDDRDDDEQSRRGRRRDEDRDERDKEKGKGGRPKYDKKPSYSWAPPHT